jgi:hypothetical protein
MDRFVSRRLTVIRDSVWRLLRRGRERIGQKDNDVRSIVLLQRSGRFLSQEEIRSASEKGWSRSFDGKEDPMYFVVQDEPVTIIKAGGLVVNVLQARIPYLGEPNNVGLQLPRKEQQDAWRRHRAWVSFDLLNKEDVSRREAFSALAKFALGTGDENCTGIYLPSERIFAPNSGGEAEEMLRLLIRKELPI